MTDSLTAIPAARTLGTVTGKEWRRATRAERTAFLAAQQRQGFVAFGCLRCRYPVAYAGAWCAACEAV